VSVHNIDIVWDGNGELPTSCPVAVAVGDTFLFAASSSDTLMCHSLLPSRTSKSNRSTPVKPKSSNNVASQEVVPLSVSETVMTFLSVGDECCLTHPIPYYHSIPGCGAVDIACNRLTTALLTPHM
jgi:hypothetical protein